MVKRLINIILILVLCITILPIEQVGNALFNNQWTEECSDHEGHQLVKIGKFAFLDDLNLFTAGASFKAVSRAKFFEYSHPLPFSVSAEIHSPPPNLV